MCMAQEKEEIFCVVASYTHIISVCIFPLCVSLALIYITAATKKGKKQKNFFFLNRRRRRQQQWQATAFSVVDLCNIEKFLK